MIKAKDFPFYEGLSFGDLLVANKENIYLIISDVVVMPFNRLYFGSLDIKTQVKLFQFIPLAVLKSGLQTGFYQIIRKKFSSQEKAL